MLVPVDFHPNPVLIRRVGEEWGFFGNMSPHPILWEGVVWPRAEHLFQAWRFAPDNPVRQIIHAMKNPMTAKMVAKEHKLQMIYQPRTSDDLERMRLLLRLKLEQHGDIRKLLQDTGDRPIVEDCSKRASESGLFWGAALVTGGDTWRGFNHLGKLWMYWRSEFGR